MPPCSGSSGKPKRLFEIQLEFEKKRFSVHQLKLIKSFFIQTGYNNFDNKKFLEKLNVDTCVYCNRNYTTQLVKDRARAELDHWFPKESFPNKIFPESVPPFVKSWV